MMKTTILCSASALLLALAAGCALTGAKKTAPAILPAEMTNAYYCPFADTPVTVDGELNEPVWAKARTVKLLIPGTFEEPISKTEARMVYDRDFLYVAFKAYDQDIWGVFAERDSSTCREDVLEIFFKTHPDQDPYFDFEINVLGTVYDAYNVKRSAGSHRWSKWNCAGLKTAVQVKGTANDWGDKDQYWILEVAVPFAELPGLNGKAPVKGDTWLFELARYDYSIYLPEGVELTSSAPLPKANFHLHENWVRLVFE